MKNKQAALVNDAFQRALLEIRARVCISVAGDIGSPDKADDVRTLDVQAGRLPALSIAYSGGLDSSVLLHLAHEYAATHQIPLFAFHIHHGISQNADAWQQHCQSECARLGITFDARQVQISRKDKSGIEEAARIGRYAALGELCRVHQVPLLLTAHHQDDQAETVLLQLLRGSGMAGLSGMELANTAVDLLGHAELLMARPLLTMSRAELAQYAVDHAIAYVEDESNSDPRYARNALRHQVMPSLEASFPGFQDRFARTAQHAQTAQRLLVELAAQDLKVCLEGDCIDLSALRQFGPDRIDNLLRYWFGSRGLRMPATAWLSEMRSQLLGARADAQLCVTHPDCHIRRYRDRVFITPKLDEESLTQPPRAFRWNGETQLDFPPFGGVLHFDPAEEGIDADWLRNRTLSIGLRSGGERLKLALNRPTKSLKYHYQACDVPPWERERLPLVMTANDLLYAAGIGMDCHHLSVEHGVRIRFRWEQRTG